MSIQVGTGIAIIDSNDPQFAYRGKTIALKVRTHEFAMIHGYVKADGGSWQFSTDLTNGLFSSSSPDGTEPVLYWVKHYGGAMELIRAVVLPRLNAWLVEQFPPSGAPVPPLEQVFVALGSIRFLPQPDGTLIASA